MKRFIIFSLAVVLIVSSCTTVQYIASSGVASPISSDRVISNGSLVYGLPRTVFTVRVKVERTVETPGPYAQYAQQLLGLDNAIMAENEFWEIAAVTVNSHIELDPSQLYVMESNGGIKANALKLKEEGFILDLNPESTERAYLAPSDNESDVNRFVSYDLGSDRYYYTEVDTAYRQIAFNSTFVNVPYISTQTRSVETSQLAQNAAENLFAIREGKMMILIGEANVFPQDASSIQELNKMERDYLELFIGKSFTETLYYTFNIIPEESMIGNETAIFNFSELSGVEGLSSSRGTAVTIKMESEEKTATISNLTILDSKNEIENVVYRVPDVTTVTISLDNEQLYNSRKLVYQFGTMLHLPSTFVF